MIKYLFSHQRQYTVCAVLCTILGKQHVLPYFFTTVLLTIKNRLKTVHAHFSIFYVCNSSIHLKCRAALLDSAALRWKVALGIC